MMAATCLPTQCHNPHNRNTKLPSKPDLLTLSWEIKYCGNFSIAPRSIGLNSKMGQEGPIYYDFIVQVLIFWDMMPCQRITGS
jgi:hypothetical protein